MNSILIGYDLDKPDQNYPNLIEAIKKLGTWWHCLDSTWIVKSNLSCMAIREILQMHIGQSDKLLVARLNGEAAWIGFSTDCSSWLKNNL